MCALDGRIDDDHLLNLTLSFLAADGYAWRIWTSTCLPIDEPGAEELLKDPVTRRAAPDGIEKKPENAMHPLTWVSIFSMTSMLKLLLPRTSSINYIQRSEYYRGSYEYPLYAASRYGSLQTVQMLMKAGASVNHHDPDYTPALLGAAYADSYEKVKFLLDEGADVNVIAPHGNALTVAVLRWSKSVLELLLQSGAKVDAIDLSFGTALMTAATIGFLDGVQVLLDAGASINCTTCFGAALQAAVRNQNEDVVKLLLQSGADPNIESLPTKELIRDAWGSLFGRRQCEMLKLLLNGGLKVGIEDWRVQLLEAELPEHRMFLRVELQQLEEVKSFLELFEALPQWQAVKDAVLSN
jgi:ankyrin repeat protein